MLRVLVKFLVKFVRQMSVTLCDHDDMANEVRTLPLASQAAPRVTEGMMRGERGLDTATLERVSLVPDGSLADFLPDREREI